MVVITLTAVISLIKLFANIPIAYTWLSDVVSKKWKVELEEYLKYLRGVKKALKPYKNSNGSATSITDALELLKGELTKSLSEVNEWLENYNFVQQLKSNSFRKELSNSRTKIDQYLHLIQYRCIPEKGNPARPQTRTKVKKTNDEKPQKRKEGSDEKPQKRKEGNHALPLKIRNDRMPQKKKEFEEQGKEKERQVNKYKDWLKKNVTKCTDSWPSYSERCTNSKLDRAEKKILFEKYVKELREQYLRDYKQLLKEVITLDLERNYLTLWSNAERLLRGHQRFDRFPEINREAEWRSHVKPILEKEREVTEYRAWLRENITKWTDSWPSYSERRKNSKLDRAEKKILFKKHVKELRERYLREYQRLLEKVITSDSAIEYLTSWSDAERLLLQLRRFGLLSQEEKEREWRSHADKILKKRKKEKKRARN